MILHVSNLNTRVLDSPTHSHQFDTNCVGGFDMWVKPNLKSASFLPDIKTFSCTEWLFIVLSRLHGRKHKCAFYWIQDQWTWLLSDIVAWDSFRHGIHYLFSDIYRCCDDHFLFSYILVNTYFVKFRLTLLIVLRALVHLIYLIIFSNFLVFNLPFLISNNNFLFPG